MRRGPIALLLLATLAVVLALGGCGGGSSDDDESATDAPPETTAPSALTADPPLAFDTSAPVKLPGSALQSNLAGDVTSSFTTLRGRTAYIVEPATLRAVDMLTGEQAWEAPIEGTPADPNAQQGPFVNDAGPRPPALSEDGTTVVAAVPITVPGEGTTPSSQAISVLAVDAASGEPRWAARVPVSAAVAPGSGRGAVTRVVAVTDSAVVVTYSDDEATTAAIDPADQRILWQRDEYAAGAVIGDVVLGTDAKVAENSSMVQGTALALTTGQQRWIGARRASQVAITPAGPGAFVVDQITYDDGDAHLLFLDPATGRKVQGYFKNRPLNTGSSFGPCDYDQRSVVVCHSFDGVLAYDATNGKQLWQLPDEAANRVAPSVTAVWHGAVYGSTANGPVVLDATTGADRSTSPGAAPSWVSEYGGIALDREGGPIGLGVQAQ